MLRMRRTNENQMKPQQNQQNGGQAGRVRSGLQWLGTLVRDVKYGTIKGILIRDGVLQKGPKFRVRRTGKPGGKAPPGTRGTLATDGVLQEALRDLGRETVALKGESKLKVKVANGTLLSWEVEEVGQPTLP